MSLPKIPKSPISIEQKKSCVKSAGMWETLRTKASNAITDQFIGVGEALLNLAIAPAVAIADALIAEYDKIYDAVASEIEAGAKLWGDIKEAKAKALKAKNELTNPAKCPSAIPNLNITPSIDIINEPTIIEDNIIQNINNMPSINV